MPSLLHEALLDLFRSRVTLAPDLLRDALHVDLPPYTEVGREEADLSQLTPTEYRADLVLLLRDGEPVFGIVLEVQLSRDDDKRWSWPLYAMALRGRWRCPTCVLVVTPERAVERWANAAIETGPCATFRPVVLGPHNVPRIDDPEAARRAPQLAVLSALSHRDESGDTDVALAAIAGAATLDAESAAFYYDLVVGGLNEAARRALEEHMTRNPHAYQTDFAKKYFGLGKAEGEAEGKVEMLLELLTLKGLSITDEQRNAVTECTDPAQFSRWLARALKAESADEVFTGE